MIVNPHSRIGRIRLKEGATLPRLEVSAADLAAFARPPLPIGVKRITAEDLFRAAQPMPGVIPAGRGMAMDDSMAAVFAWAASGAISQGVTWLGYPYLAELTQRPEYRRPAEILAKEMTRKWIKLKAAAETGKGDKIKAIAEDMRKFRVRDVFRNAIQTDGFFGRAQIYMDFGDDGRSPELATPLILTKAKIGKGRLRRLRNVEPMWSYPALYNSTNPLAGSFYTAETWWVQGVEVSSSRLLTLIGREVPDMLKPAYSFGGLSLSQMLQPYVDNWLRARQSVSDLMHSFSVMVLSTNMAATLADDGGAQALERRIELFNMTRDNRGTMMIDKDLETLTNVSASLASLDKLQAQAQEHMAAVVGIPLVVLLGITPSGLNASSDGEIRVFYDWVNAQQEDLLRDPLDTVLKVLQLNRFGEVDPDIVFEFVPLYQLSAKELADMRKVDADTDAVYVELGVMDADDIRATLGADDEGRYTNVDFSGPAPEPPDQGEPPGQPGQPGQPGEQEQDDPQPGERAVPEAAEDGKRPFGIDLALDEFIEADHPRDESGKFTTVSGGEGLHSAIGSYFKGLKASGKKPTSTNLIKHLVQTGGIPTGEIAGAASTLFKNTAHGGHVSLAYKALTEAGLNPPPLLAGKGAAAKAPAMAPVKPTPPPAPAAPVASPPGAQAPSATPAAPVDLPKPDSDMFSTAKVKAEAAYSYAMNSNDSYATKIKNLEFLNTNGTGAALKDYLNKLTAAVKEQAPAGAAASLPVSAPPSPPPPPPPDPPKPMKLETKQEFDKLQEAWANVLPANKPALDAKVAEIKSALDKPTAKEQAAALAALTPIANPVGMGQQSANTFLMKVQQEFGTKPPSPPTAALPPGKPSAAVFHAAKVAPHKTTVTESEYEDSSGGTVTARLEARTKNIPGDHYAKVTAAYGNNPDGMTQAVDKAMQDYANDTHASHTKAQLAAIKAYRDGEYGEINKALSGLSKPTPATQKHIDEIHGAMKNSFVPADTPVFRGLRGDFAAVTGFADPQEAVGRAFVHKNFASVSRSEGTARHFGDRTVLSFTIPAGTPGVVMKGQSHNDSLVEREIMMDSNSMFRVEKVVQSVGSDGTARHVIHCTYLGTKQ